METVTDYSLVDGSGSEVGYSFSANRGSQGANSIFCYFDGFGESVSGKNAFVQYRKPDGSLTSNYQANAVVDACIAYNQRKDMSFFRYGKTYRFVRFDLPSPDVMKEAGAYSASVFVTWDESRTSVFSPICFSVVESSISPDKDISESQFYVLLNMISKGINADVSVDADAVLPSPQTKVPYYASHDALPTSPTILRSDFGISAEWPADGLSRGLFVFIAHDLLFLKVESSAEPVWASLSTGVALKQGQHVMVSYGSKPTLPADAFFIKDATSGESKDANAVYDELRIQDNEVTTQKIADGAVTPEKLDRPYLPTAGGTITGNLAVNGYLLTGGELRVADVMRKGDLYFGLPSDYGVGGRSNMQYLATREWADEQYVKSASDISFTGNNTYSGGNTFSGVNTFSGDNHFTATNTRFSSNVTFSGATAFEGMQTFGSLFLSGVMQMGSGAYFLYNNRQFTFNGATAPERINTIATEAYVDGKTDDKVVKDSSAQAKVYGTDPSGDETTYQATPLALGGTVPLRNSSGNFNVGSPTADGHTANKKYVDDQIARVRNGVVQIVSQLPDTGEEGVFYFVPSGEGYEQWAYEGGQWIDMGKTQIDLSDYYTKADVDGKLEAKLDNAANSVTGTNIANGAVSPNKLDKTATYEVGGLKSTGAIEVPGSGPAFKKGNYTYSLPNTGGTLITDATELPAVEGATIKLTADIDQLQAKVPYYASESALPTTLSAFSMAFGKPTKPDGLVRYVFVNLGGSDAGLYAIEACPNSEGEILWGPGKKKLEAEMIVRIECGEIAATGKPGGKTFYVINDGKTASAPVEDVVSELATASETNKLWDAKLDKVDVGPAVYAVDAHSTQIMLPISEVPAANSVPLWDSDKQLLVRVDDNSNRGAAVNKDYLEKKLASRFVKLVCDEPLKQSKVPYYADASAMPTTAAAVKTAFGTGSQDLARGLGYGTFAFVGGALCLCDYSDNGDGTLQVYGTPQPIAAGGSGFIDCSEGQFHYIAKVAESESSMDIWDVLTPVGCRFDLEILFPGDTLMQAMDNVNVKVKMVSDTNRRFLVTIRDMHNSSLYVDSSDYHPVIADDLNAESFQMQLYDGNYGAIAGLNMLSENLSSGRDCITKIAVQVAASGASTFPRIVRYAPFNITASGAANYWFVTLDKLAYNPDLGRAVRMDYRFEFSESGVTTFSPIPRLMDYTPAAAPTAKAMSMQSKSVKAEINVPEDAVGVFSVDEQGRTVNAFTGEVIG